MMRLPNQSSHSTQAAGELGLRHIRQRMWRYIIFLLPILLNGCSTLFLSRDQFAGSYMQDGLIWGTAASMELRADGSYFIADEVVECMPNFEKGPQYGVSYAKGKWLVDGNELVLTQSEYHQGNFASTGNFGSFRFRISVSIFNPRLIQVGVKSPMIMKKIKGRIQKVPESNHSSEPATRAVH